MAEDHSVDPAEASDAAPLSTKDRRRLLTRLYDLNLQRLVEALERGDTSAALTMAAQKVLDAQGVDFSTLQREADGPLPDALMQDLPTFADDPVD